MRVAVCGGGVIGACLAFFLARRGAAVTVIERTAVACAASGKSGGFLALDWCDGTALGPLARRENFPGIPEMAAALRALREEKLIWAVVEALAQGETGFFRDRAPFAAFQKELLPTLARLRGAEPIRVWSCACATGQEAYSLAMIAEEAEGLPPGTRVEIYGSDLSERSLEKAQAGLYTQFEVQRGLPIRQLLQQFEKVEDNWRLTPRIRQRVRWRRVNLISDLAVMGRFDVIFCRNVLSAMDGPYRRRVLESLAALLPAPPACDAPPSSTPLAAATSLTTSPPSSNLPHPRSTP